MQMLAFGETPARRYKPKKLRYRIFTIGATLGPQRTTRLPAPVPHVIAPVTRQDVRAETNVTVTLWDAPRTWGRHERVGHGHVVGTSSTPGSRCSGSTQACAGGAVARGPMGAS